MKRLLIVLVLLGAGAGAGWWYWTQGGQGPAATTAAGRPAGATGATARGRRGPNPDTPIPVLAARAERRDVPIWLDALGTVQAYNLVSVRAMIEGPLQEVLFTEGQDVKQGDILARIDPRPYQASLDAALAKKQQDEALLANARLDYARYSRLASAGSSQQQIDTARSQVAQLEAQVRGDQAQIDTARTNLSYTVIQAPIDGRTGVRQVDAGNIVHTGDANPITVLAQLRPISVVFTLPQQALQPVKTAMQAGPPQVLAMAGATGIGRLLDKGELTVLDNQVDSATGTIKLKATFPNADLRLWPGGFVNVRLLADTRRDATTVPVAAVQRGPRGAFVYVINPDNTVRRQMVTVSHEDDKWSIVTAGLNPGDQVVTDGAQRLNETSKVAIAGPDGTAPEAAPPERTAPGTAQRGSRRNAS